MFSYTQLAFYLYAPGMIFAKVWHKRLEVYGTTFGLRTHDKVFVTLQPPSTVVVTGLPSICIDATDKLFVPLR